MSTKISKTKSGDNLEIPLRYDLMVVRKQIIELLLDRGYKMSEISLITNIDPAQLSRALKKK